MAFEQFAVKAVDADLHRLPRVHMRQLGLLEIGHHIGFRKRHDRKDLAARCHVGADPHRTLTDHAIHRCDNARVRQLITGHFQRGLGAFESTFGGVTLGGEDFHLLAFGGQHGGGFSQARSSLVDARLGLLGVLHGARTDAGKVVVAVQFVFGKGHFGAICCHGGLGLGDHRALALQGRAGVFQLGLGDQGVGIGGLGGGAKIAVVDQRQQLPGFDTLVVFHQHFLDKAGNAGSDQGEIRRDEGVVGGLVLAAQYARRNQVNQHADGKYSNNGDGNFVFAFHGKSLRSGRSARRIDPRGHPENQQDQRHRDTGHDDVKIRRGQHHGLLVQAVGEARRVSVGKGRIAQAVY